MVGHHSRSRTRRVLLWLGLIVALLVLAAIVVVVTAPRWGASRLESELEQRLGRRLDAKVEIAQLEASWRGATLRGVEIERESFSTHIDTLRLDVERAALWGGRVSVAQLEARGGSLVATRSALEDMARRVLELRSEGEGEGGSWVRRRVRLTPQQLKLEQLAFELDDGPERHLSGSLAMEASPSEEQVELRVQELVAELGVGRLVRAGELRTSLARERGELRFPLALEVEGLATQIDEHIAVAGVQGSVELADARASEIGVELVGGFAELREDGLPGGGGQQLWSVSGDFARDLSRGKLAVEMEAFALGRVPEVLAALPLVESEAATVGGQLELEFGAGQAQLDGELTLSGLNVSHRLLAREVVRDVGFRVELDAQVDPRARALELRALRVTRGGVELRVRGSLVHAREREQRRYQVELEVPEVACQAVLDAIPRELVPGLQGFELGGRFTAALQLDADFSKLDELALEGSIGIDGCTVEGAPHLASAARLSGAFVHRVTMRDGRTRRVPLYAGSSYTPLDGISRFMTEAVLTTEDGSFRRHDGFNRTQLGVALRRNLQSGKVRIGASTITMQMVKNVLLSHERTLSRKLQELFLTWWVEQALSKQRIMELYLNVIEFGPGIYGVSNAARHYFGKHPSELGSLEAAYLAAMLPSPVRRHVHYCNGELSERFERKVHWVHGLMLERGRITAEEHQAYAALGLQFDLLERGDPDLCREEIDTLMAGTHPQRALSGLLGDGDGDEGLLPGGPGHPPSHSWGVRPPLPWVDAQGALNGAEPGQRLEPAPSWRVPDEPVDEDPAMADAPGRPAMDE